jgi:hypothetical protein
MVMMIVMIDGVGHDDGGDDDDYDDDSDDDCDNRWCWS